jgi:hypothetical protein
MFTNINGFEHLKYNISSCQDLDWLWQNKTMVHYFGLGFIQLKLDKYHRIHFYTDKLMKTVGDEEIHNHRYNFVSMVLRGQFSQDIYDVIKCEEDFTHYLRDESCNEDNKIEGPEEKVKISKFYSHTLKQGESYFMDHGSFHTVESNDAITLLTRSDYKKEFAQVISPKDAPSICPFSIKLSESEIFDILKELLHGLS